MSERRLQLDDVRLMDSPRRIADLFRRLGYRTDAEVLPLDLESLELPPRSQAAIRTAFLIAEQPGTPSLQVLLLELDDREWESSSTASGRMKAIAKALSQKPDYYLLLATNTHYDRLLVVHPRKSLDSQGNIRTGIRKLLIDRRNPTAYDRDRLEALAVNVPHPRELYQAHCAAFDVEKITKEFYRGYQALFQKVQIIVKNHNPHPYFADQKRLHQFCQRMLGRIMFLYFLQKKNFLAGDRQFLTQQYRRRNLQAHGTEYYSEVLENLFFNVLNTPMEQRSGLPDAWCRGIPYLNGGLFERDYGVGIVDGAGQKTPDEIHLPNSLFDPGDTHSILAFFNRYNFTVAENLPGDEDVAVDPEMLGKVFENLLEEQERGKSGTFYTPRGIVQFMCESALCHYLASETGIKLEAIQELLSLDLAEISSTELNEKLSRTEAQAIKTALSHVKILDPAVGSGAFPLGMMQVILSLRQVVARREGMTVERGSLLISEWKREIIANNLYGVDIKPEAVEIAKLRLWLSLVVDIPRIEDVEPLPNLDYKLMCGDSLITTINGEHIIPDPRKSELQLSLMVSPLQAEIQKLVELEKKFYFVNAEERNALRTEILNIERNIFITAIQNQRKLLEDKRKLKEAGLLSAKKVNKAMQDEYDRILLSIQRLNEFEAEVLRGERSLTFFQYPLHFQDVFQQGGFDIVIGNPPYVRQEQIKDLKPALQREYECYTGRADLFVYFYEQGLNLLKPGGYLTYISSNKYMRSSYGEKLRDFLGNKSKILHLIDFGDTNVFEEAIAYPSIILLQKEAPKQDTNSVKALTWSQDEPLDNFPAVFKQRSILILQKELTRDGWRLESPSVLRLLEKLRKAGTPLGEYVNGRFYYGIKTGLNEAFVVDRATRDRLIAEHPSSAEILKPFLRGKDVKRWRVDYQDLWLIFTRRGIEIKKYPAIHDYLLQFEDRLTPGIPGGRKPGSYKWYEIQDNIAYWQEFERPKIIISIFAKSPTFTFDDSGFYVNNALHIIGGGSKYIVGLLNSSTGWWFLMQICTDLQNGYSQAYKENIEQIPIPPASPTDKNSIETLVQKCLDSQGQGVEQWEQEIDEIVARLYGLSAEDMKIIQETNQ
jgi:adenine-specific DNA-methyltransferase